VKGWETNRAKGKPGGRVDLRGRRANSQAVPPVGLLRLGGLCLLLAGCASPETDRTLEVGPEKPLSPSNGRSVPIHALPVACQLGHGGGIFHEGSVIVAGLLMEGGCQDYKPGTPWNPPLPWRGAPPGILVAMGSHALPRGAWAEDPWGPVAFAFPVSLGDHRWGLAWGQAIEGTDFERGGMGGEGWPPWLASRFWTSEYSNGEWLAPSPLDSAAGSFRTPVLARHATLSGEGSAVLLVEENFPGAIRGPSPKVRLWSAPHGVTTLPFVPEPLPTGGSPVLALDGRGSHWIAWIEERGHAESRGHVFMLQDVGPGGTAVRERREVPLMVQNGDRIRDLTLVFDALDRPHLLWMDGLVSPHFSHAAEVGPDGAWVAFPVENPSNGQRTGSTVGFLASADSEGGLYLHESTSNPMATDGTFGNVNLWRWGGGGWEFEGVDEGPGRADVDLLAVLHAPGPGSRMTRAAVWTSVTWPTPDDISSLTNPDRFLRLHVPEP
jgi:hypothetical protein